MRRILIASKRRPGIPGRRDGGVQTWVATVAAELRGRGHVVDVLGAADKARGVYEAGVLANLGYTAPFAALCERVVRISHGIVADEAPGEGPGALLFTSEEVRAHWGGRGGIMRQPIDLRFWFPGKDRGRYLTRFANRGGLTLAPAVAGQLGLEYRHARGLSPAEAREALWQSACVLASGRCAVEAMACGVPVVICDERHYQGPLLDPDTEAAMTRNYSGRGGVTPTPDNLQAAIARAMARGSLRRHAQAHHDVRVIVDQLLDAAA